MFWVYSLHVASPKSRITIKLKLNRKHILRYAVAYVKAGLVFYIYSSKLNYRPWLCHNVVNFDLIDLTICLSFFPALQTLQRGKICDESWKVPSQDLICKAPKLL